MAGVGADMNRRSLFRTLVAAPLAAVAAKVGLAKEVVPPSDGTYRYNWSFYPSKNVLIRAPEGVIHFGSSPPGVRVVGVYESKGSTIINVVDSSNANVFGVPVKVER